MSTPRRSPTSRPTKYWLVAGVGAIVALALTIVVMRLATQSPSSLNDDPIQSHSPQWATDTKSSPSQQPNQSPLRPRSPGTLPRNQGTNVGPDVLVDPESLAQQDPLNQPDQGTRDNRRPRTAPPVVPLPETSPQAPRPAPESIALPRDVNAPPPEKLPSPPRPAVNPPNPPSALSLAFRSELGGTLVPGEAPGTWRWASGEVSSSQPLTVVSLADSWTSATMEGVGTLILESDTRAIVSRDPDRVVRVSVEHGHVGLRDMTENTEVRISAGGETWSARGLGSHSTFAVVRDDRSAGVYVASGIIAVDDTQVMAGQLSLVQSGVPSLPQSISTATSTTSSPFAADPYDARWLNSPDEKRKRDWQSAYGKLAESLASAPDAAAAIRQLRESARDNRHHALLARWNLAVAPDRGLLLWELLGDRQKSTRIAATQELLSIPPQDGRLRAIFPSIRAVSDQSTAAMLLEWVGRSHRGNTLTPAQARELVDGLGHNEPAVRQVAVYLLEHYSQDALAAARMRPPAFDARDTTMRRAAAQAQWRAIAAQLFLNRNRGAANKVVP